MQINSNRYSITGRIVKFRYKITVHNDQLQNNLELFLQPY